VHVPPTHDWPAEQALSQLPQLKTSVLRSTQLAAHIVCPGTLHVVEQIPAEHTCPARHATPHAPQLSASVAGFVQAPLHWVSPTWHSQAPAMHDWPVTQTTPQAPQWLESMLRSTQAEAHRVWPVWQPAVVPSTPTCALPPVAPGRRVWVRSEQLHATRTSAAILATMGATWMSRGVDMRSDSGCGGGSMRRTGDGPSGSGPSPQTPLGLSMLVVPGPVSKMAVPPRAGSGRTTGREPSGPSKSARMPRCLGASGRGQHEGLRLQAGIDGRGPRHAHVASSPRAALFTLPLRSRARITCGSASDMVSH
jgi:hypothetical protein